MGWTEDDELALELTKRIVVQLRYELGTTPFNPYEKSLKNLVNKKAKYLKINHIFNMNKIRG